VPNEEKLCKIKWKGWTTKRLWSAQCIISTFEGKKHKAKINPERRFPNEPEMISFKIQSDAIWKLEFL
jgi:hypothetical protein